MQSQTRYVICIIHELNKKTIFIFIKLSSPEIINCTNVDKIRFVYYVISFLQTRPSLIWSLLVVR